MIKTKIVYFLLSCIFALGFLQTQVIAEQGDEFTVEIRQTAGGFPLVHNGTAAKIVFDAGDAPVVRIAAEALEKDITLVTGARPGIYAGGEQLPKMAIIIGTMEKSRFIKEMCESKKIPAERIQGKWETFLITVVRSTA